MVVVQVLPVLFRLFPEVETLKKTILRENVGVGKYTLNTGGVPCRRGR